jgi:hypothetical protein
LRERSGEVCETRRAYDKYDNDNKTTSPSPSGALRERATVREGGMTSSLSYSGVALVTMAVRLSPQDACNLRI